MSDFFDGSGTCPSGTLRSEIRALVSAVDQAAMSVKPNEPQMRRFIAETSAALHRPSALETAEEERGGNVPDRRSGCVVSWDDRRKCRPLGFENNDIRNITRLTLDQSAGNGRRRFWNAGGRRFTPSVAEAGRAGKWRHGSISTF
jgi:hypothetical protein